MLKKSSVFKKMEKRVLVRYLKRRFKRVFLEVSQIDGRVKLCFRNFSEHGQFPV